MEQPEQKPRKCPTGLECNECRWQTNMTISGPGQPPQQVMMCIFEAILVILSSGRRQQPSKEIKLPPGFNPFRTPG